MNRAAVHLKVVDTETGEVIEGCPDCRRYQDQIAGLERDIKGWRARNAELKRDKDAQARDSDVWPAAVWLFKHWQHVCKHPKSVFTTDRFWAVHPFLSNPRYGDTLKARVALCRRAINGAAFDPHTKPRKNGTVKRFDDWGLVFRDADHLEDFANRAPKEPKA